MACGFINLQHINLEANVSNILSKHWGYQACWELIRPILHFEGDTGNLFYDDTGIENHEYMDPNKRPPTTENFDQMNFHDGEFHPDGEFESEDT
jgi:hypothetical protein